MNQTRDHALMTTNRAKIRRAPWVWPFLWWSSSLKRHLWSPQALDPAWPMSWISINTGTHPNAGKKVKNEIAELWPQWGTCHWKLPSSQRSVRLPMAADCLSTEGVRGELIKTVAWGSMRDKPWGVRSEACAKRSLPAWSRRIFWGTVMFGWE